MIIIFFEFLAIIYCINALQRRYIKLSNVLIIGLSIQVITLVLYRINLDYIGRDVYFSDSEVYWNNTLQLLRGQKLTGYGTQVGYAYFCALIELLSPFYSVLWLNISNVLIVDISVLILCIIIYEDNHNRSNIKLFAEICLFNPLIIYSLLRNMKDALFLFIIVVIILLYTKIKRNRKWIYIIPIILLTIVVSTIRPWGFLIMPVLAIDGFLSSDIGSPKKRLIITIIILTLFIIVLKATSLWDHVLLWEPIVIERASKLSMIEIISAPIKILTGPGPYRSFFGNDYFLYTTTVGNIASGIGSIVWWMAISTMLANIKSFRITKCNLTVLLVCLMFLGIYSMQYGGSLELRFRGVIYILFAAMFFSGLKKHIKVTPVSVLIFIIALPVGTILSA